MGGACRVRLSQQQPKRGKIPAKKKGTIAGRVRRFWNVGKMPVPKTPKKKKKKKKKKKTKKKKKKRKKKGEHGPKGGFDINVKKRVTASHRKTILSEGGEDEEKKGKS